MKDGAEHQHVRDRNLLLQGSSSRALAISQCMRNGGHTCQSTQDQPVCLPRLTLLGGLNWFSDSAFSSPPNPRERISLTFASAFMTFSQSSRMLADLCLISFHRIFFVPFLFRGDPLVFFSRACFQPSQTSWGSSCSKVCVQSTSSSITPVHKIFVCGP